ncbi:hypothetical protein LIER_09259 [Lithospermum erythrorhizon]|uniref:Uncharacterized protein n=1 Tax=Lithospermum erythrorhizon TaxID=34254 RepID=A0AAV3PF37_LITER
MKVKMCVDEQWKKEAMLDDTVVAELLLKLNAPPYPPPPKPPLAAVEWKVRQRRSKTLTGKSPLPRASPTTPLSWSGGTSVSGGGGGGGGGGVDGGSEESSQPQPPLKKPQSSRSNKVASDTMTGKRPRKKKTLAELKAAELTLKEERKQLLEEVKRVRANLDRERSSHEKFKRLKLELESQTESSSNQVAKLASSVPHAGTTLPRMDSVDTSPKQCSPFAIPDLNLPLEDDCNIEVQCVAS